MSYTDQYINDLREAGLVTMDGTRLVQELPNWSYGDRQPVQGANGDRINPSDVLGQERFLERRAAKMDEKPVAFWFKGDARYAHPGWAYCYNEVAENNGEYRATTKKDGKAIQKWLVGNGYRKLYSWKGNGEITTFRECWMHVRYSGDGSDPQDFHPKSTAEIREYISLALKTDEPETVAPELPTEEATVQPDHVESIVDKVAGWIGIYFDAKQAGWLA